MNKTWAEEASLVDAHTSKRDAGTVFFFQAEDGIRDYKVTGVQTCALPIFRRGTDAGARAGAGGQFQGPSRGFQRGPHGARVDARLRGKPAIELHRVGTGRSEERRVGKECRSRWSPYH